MIGGQPRQRVAGRDDRLVAELHDRSVLLDHPDVVAGDGHTVVEGAKFSGEKLKESGQAASPPAKSAWAHLKDGSVKESANAFGSSVKSFFTRLFSN